MDGVMGAMGPVKAGSTVGVTATWIASVVVFRLHPGLSALAAATILIVFRTAKEAELSYDNNIVGLHDLAMFKRETGDHEAREKGEVVLHVVADRKSEPCRARPGSHQTTRTTSALSTNFRGTRRGKAGSIGGNPSPPTFPADRGAFSSGRKGRVRRRRAKP